jgi:hypothetical protein
MVYTIIPQHCIDDHPVHPMVGALHINKHFLGDQKMHNNIHTYMYIKVLYFYFGYLYRKEYHINNKEKSRKRKIDLYLYQWLKNIS